MQIKKINFRYNVIYKNETLNNCSRLLEVLDHKILFVINKEKKLIGSISDGDIRRAVMKNKIKENSKIISIMNKSPAYINFSKKGSYSNSQITRILKVKKYLPILNNKKIREVIYLSNQDSSINKTNVIINAGGFGKRLYPITKKTPKPNILINQHSNIVNILNSFYENGFRNFFITLHYKSGMIKKEVNRFFNKKAKIKYYVEKRPLGTFGGIKKISSKFRLKENIIVINSDIITNLKFNNLKSFFEEKKFNFLLCCKKNSLQIPYGVIEEKKGLLKKIVEKPKFEFNINTGIYMIKPDVINKIDFKKTQVHLTDLINSCIKKKIKINLFPISEFWIDYGSKDILNKIEKDNFIF